MQSHASDDGHAALIGRIQSLELRIEQLQAEEAALRRDAHALRQRELLFDLSLEMLCVAGMDGYFKQVNPAFPRTLGYSPEELLARPLMEFVHPDDRQRTAAEMARLRGGAITVSFENRYRCKDGSHRWLAWTAVPRLDEAMIYATASDVTARRRAEQRFRLLLESAPDGMVIVDREGRIALVNLQTERLFGYSADELIGQPVEILVPERLRTVHARHNRAYATDPQPRAMGSRPDLTARRKDGSEFAAEISLSPIETEEGVLVASAIRDVTERRLAERALRQREVQLLAAQRIQQHLLPPSSPDVPGFDIAGASYPAEFAAGDHFDYLPMADGTWGIVISDVSGHGFSTALLMAVTHAYLRLLSGLHGQISEILARANRALSQEMEAGRFVTLLFCRLDPHSRSLRYVNAGHPPGWVIGAGGQVRHRLDGEALPLGVLAATDFGSEGTVTLEPGDVLVLLTDGVLEAASPGRDDPFGENRMLEVVRASRQSPASRIVSAVHDAVRAFSGAARQEDDMTLVVVKVAQP